MQKQHVLSLARSLLPVARAAGELTLKYRSAGAGDVMSKQDGSPVTVADREAERLIFDALARLAPGIPAIGEEAAEEGRIPDISGGSFFLIDPLDGTREFIRGGPDFTVNIALLENFRPVMGIIFAPAHCRMYFAAGGEAFSLTDGEEKRMLVRPAPEEGLTVLGSRRASDRAALEEFLRSYRVKTWQGRSSSLKFCLIAEGLADLYPRLGPTSEWDTAAGEAILTAAGGVVQGLDGHPLPYGKVDRKFVNSSFVARAGV